MACTSTKIRHQSIDFGYFIERLVEFMTSADNKIFGKYQSSKVILVGWYGAGNLGDELLLSRMIRAVHLQGMEPIVVSLDPTYTTHCHSVQSIDFEDLEALQFAIDGAYACVLGGGGLFQTYSSFRYASLFEFGLGDVASYARPILLAQQLGVPTSLFAQGVGPLETPESREIVALLFSSVSCVSVRDIASHDLLRSIGVLHDITVAPDPIWAWEVPASSQLSRAQSHKKIVLVVRDWPFVSGWEDRLLSALREAFDPALHELLWLPFQARNVQGRSSSDTDLLRRLMARLGDYWNQSLLEWTSIPQAIEMLASADAVIAMRMHAQILALKLDKPTLCLEYDEKMAQVSLQAGVPHERRVRLTDGQGVWLQAVKSLLSKGADSSVKIDHIQNLARQSDTHFDLIWRTLGNLAQKDINFPKPNTQSIDWLWFWRTWKQARDVKSHSFTRLQESDLFAAKASEELKSLTPRSFYSDSMAFEMGLRALHARNMELQQAFAQKEQEIIAERSRYQLLHADRKQSFELLQAQTARAESLETQIQEIHATRSWRLVKKLRVGLDFFRSLRYHFFSRDKR